MLGVIGAFALVFGIAAAAHAPWARVSVDATKSRAWVLNEQTKRLVSELPDG